MAAGSARVVLVVMAMFSAWWCGGSGQLEPWQTRPTPERFPVCRQCYKGLCNADDYRENPEPVVDRLFPNLFTTLDDAGYDSNCEVLFDEMINEDTEARVSCPWRPEEAFTQRRRGCDKWWQKSDLDQCCETCRFRRMPYVVPTANTLNGEAFVVHLRWRVPPLYQSFHVGYCGAKRSCSGKCHEVVVKHKVLVSYRRVTSALDLLSQNWWFETIEFPAYCYCGGAVHG